MFFTFDLSFLRFSISLLCETSYITPSSREKPLFRTFAHIRQHHFSKYWGDGYMGRPPPQILGDRPPSPPRSPPMHAGKNNAHVCMHVYIYIMRVYACDYIHSYMCMMCKYVIIV